MKRTKLRQVSKNPANVKIRRNKARSITITKLKAQLWQLCRELTFKKYGNDCYTCPARNLSGSNLHCGHFIPSSVSSMELRYSLDNLRPQCGACNIWRSGNWPAYEAALIRDDIDVEALKHWNQVTKGRLYGRLWVENKIKEYTELLSQEN